jgi:uncharacterized protein YjbJ (UPF0337 family)
MHPSPLAPKTASDLTEENTMKMTFALLAAATGAAAIAVYYALNTPAPQHATGSDTLESAARSTANWGSKNRLSGAGSRIAGKLKEGFGRATGSADLTDEGVGDQLAGSLKSAAGEVAQAAGQTLHDFNR